MAYVYILKCTDGTYYTGSAVDVEKRVRAHVLKSKSVAKYTRSRTVESVAAIWHLPDLSSAGKLEYQIKKHLTHSEKVKLVNEPDLLATFINLESRGIDAEYCGSIAKEKLDEIREKTGQK